MGVPQSSILVGFSLRKTIHLTSIWRDPHFRKPPYVLVKKWGWVCTPENGDGTVAERDRMTLFCGFFWCNGSMNSVWGYWNVYLQITMGIYEPRTLFGTECNWRGVPTSFSSPVAFFGVWPRFPTPCLLLVAKCFTWDAYLVLGVFLPRVTA